MATKTFADHAAIDAALAALTPAQLATVSAAPAPAPALAGSLVLTYPDALASMIGAPMPVAMLAARLSAAAKSAADAVTAQVATCETHLAGYTNAAMYVAAAGGVPTNDPVKTAFASMAAANGLTPATFATLCDALSATAMALSGTLATLQVAAAKAGSAADLATALTAFEGSLTSLVGQMNGAGLTVTIVAPAAITIVGINANA